MTLPQPNDVMRLPRLRAPKSKAGRETDAVLRVNCGRQSDRESIDPFSGKQSVERCPQRTRLTTGSRGLGDGGLWMRGLEEPSIRVAAAFVSKQATRRRSRHLSIWSCGGGGNPRQTEAPGPEAPSTSPSGCQILPPPPRRHHPSTLRPDGPSPLYST